MRLFPLVALAALTFTPSTLAKSADAPYTQHSLRLINRHGMAHACPIAPDLALTSAHVIDLKPFDPSVPLFGGRYESISGRASGVYSAVSASQSEDIGVITGSSPWASYPIAAEAPKPGDDVYWNAYDFRKRDDILAPRQMTAKVTRVVAGNIVIGGFIEEGASGSCLFNSEGLVVGVIAWRVGSDVDNVTVDSAGVAVAVFGKWLAPVEKIRERFKLPALPEAEITVQENDNAAQ